MPKVLKKYIYWPFILNTGKMYFILISTWCGWPLFSPVLPIPLAVFSLGLLAKPSLRAKKSQPEAFSKPVLITSTHTHIDKDEEKKKRREGKGHTLSQVFILLPSCHSQAQMKRKDSRKCSRNWMGLSEGGRDVTLITDECSRWTKTVVKRK